MTEDLLEKVIKIYDPFYERDEMFLLGYLMACGGESVLLSSIEHGMELIGENAEFWFPIIREELEIRRKVFEERVENAKRLLREKLKKRGAGIPQWLGGEKQ
ncbi:MAG: hypothetical protein DRN91_08465 [Candidatus Alkanophagales archaeon]|nr:MAG: hypothetical protein DRN91_08465 [Candidatus Alkanophagales archaeon]